MTPEEKERYATKWYKYLYKALTTKNPNMRKFFNKKATEYALLTIPDLEVRINAIKSKRDVVLKDRYGSLRDKMIDE